MRFSGDGDVQCRSCHELYSASDLDRYLWCLDCRKELYSRGARWGRLVGFAASLGVALYVGLAVRPGRDYMILYALALTVAYVLMRRITIALVQGIGRAKSMGVSEQ